MGVVGAQYPYMVGQQFGEGGGSSGCIPCLPTPHCEVVSDSESVGMVRAEHPVHVLQQFSVRGGGPYRIRRQ